MTRKILALLVVLAASPASAGGTQVCSLAGHGPDGENEYDVRKVEYFRATDGFDSRAFRCDSQTGRCSLSGYMISRHHTAGNQPGIVFLHGSEGGVPGFVPVEDDQSLDSYSCPIKRFVDNGYVVFMPFRRGVVDQTNANILPTNADTNDKAPTGWSNTGWAANEWAINRVQEQGVDMNTDNYTGQLIVYLDREIDDLVFVIRTFNGFIRHDMRTRLVDPSRIAIVGHSIGGAMSTFASSDSDLYDPTILPHGPRAFVSLSGAAMSYHDSHWWHDVLTGAAAINHAPIIMTRVLNEDARTPNDFASLDDVLDATGNFTSLSGGITLGPVSLHCSPGVPSYKCAHYEFVSNDDQIDRWWKFVDGHLQAAGM